MRATSLMLTLVCAANAHSQITPEISAWILNTGAQKGYNNILSNVQKVEYSSSNVYVSATCIPGYDIGPWSGNPNTPSNQNFVFKITRQPVKNTGTPVATPLGHVAVFTNGVSAFNPKDAMSYNNAGVWNRNAQYYEASSFDNCLGHPAPNGEYHNHVNPKCLYNDADSTHHSPIIGFAFDGFPIYGAYGYANSNGTGGVKRMKSGYTLSTSGSRANGPLVSSTYPAGCFVEDFIYSSSTGDLDEHNGRVCVTPEYPSGTYAYFVTIDSKLAPAYPYVIGSTYYGTVPAGNTGPGSGHNTVSEPVTTYIPTGINSYALNSTIKCYPNPVSSKLNIDLGDRTNTGISLFSLTGEMMLHHNSEGGSSESLDLSGLQEGVYFLKITSGQETGTLKILIER
jgi:hypothetical protein